MKLKQLEEQKALSEHGAKLAMAQMEIEQRAKELEEMKLMHEKEKQEQ